VLEQLLNHINRHALCKTTDKILLAVSGGLDSMVMFHLFKDAGYRIAVVHCNFQLRGDASDGDEAFVADTCRQFDVLCFSKKFDTSAYAAEHKVSIQMAARDLRYAYFKELTATYGFDHVATAHHFSDTVESVFLNLIRGTGMDGFRGIAPAKDNVIRPLLFATREMIREYAVKENISWREDASNESDDYQRNFLRHNVIPQIREMNPSFEEGFRQTQERLLGAREFALAYIDHIRSTAVVADGDSLTIDIAGIRQSSYASVLLWELIKDRGFKYDMCRKIVMDHQPGKLFYSDTHQLLVDRVQYIIDKIKPQGIVSQIIEEGQRLAGNGSITLTIREVSKKDFALKRDDALAQLDADMLRFPLLWRKWQAGDYFVPLGMHTEKKVSDFLIDLKIPFNSKADVTVLESAGEIVWIVGHRISEHFKVTTESKRIIVIEPVPVNA